LPGYLLPKVQQWLQMAMGVSGIVRYSPMLSIRSIFLWGLFGFCSVFVR